MEREQIKVGTLAFGTFLLICFFQLGDAIPFQATAGGAFTYVAPLEFRFWLGHAVFVIPGVVLACRATVPRTARHVSRLWSFCAESSQRRWLAIALCYFSLLFFGAALGREIFLLGLPITDDENAVRFGGEILAGGRLFVPVLEPDGAYTQLYTFRQDGMVGSVEYPGTLAIAALAVMTGLGNTLHALLGAATGCVVAAAVGTITGRLGAVVAAIVWFGSPMAMTLSMTGHSHVASRFLISLAILLYLRIVAGSDRSRRTLLGLGLVGGLAFLTRSAEAGVILAPLAVHVLALGRSDRGLRREIGLAALVAIACLGLYAWFNIQTTGTLMPARFGTGIEDPYQTQVHSVGERLGTHLAHNWMLFGIMALGPAGLVAIAFAYGERPTWLWTLSASGAALLSLSLFHDDVGIHEVGPIHLSDLVPIAVIVASVGIQRFVGWLSRAGVRRRDAAVPIVGYFVCAMGIFTLVHGLSLRAQAQGQAVIFDAVAANVEAPAIVLGPEPIFLRQVRYDTALAGGWVHQFPHPDPDLQAPVIYARETTDIEQLVEKFPNRKFYRLLYRQGAVPVQVIRVR